MKRLLALAAVGVFALSACGSSLVSSDSTSNGASDASDFYSSKLITVDGVRCVVVESYGGNAVAVSCDWTTAPGNASNG